MQSKLSSLIEVVCSTAFGFVVSLILQIVLANLYHLNTTIQTDIKLVVWFTIASIVRGYVFRRFFNKIASKALNGTSK